ncbi:MAG: TIGR03088 family PEP-CTERM/XrtA system glycosyltransferase [Rubrivivax sp.]|nr:TIGR03088 family PEP-CTERM/XrtA system glycosyltransferase [Rubrivivax sp.]
MARSAEAPPPLVVHVIHHLVIGGMENGLVNIINTMAETAYRHAVLCIEDFSDFRQRIHRPDVQVYALNRSRIGTWALRRALYGHFRSLRPAIVHSRAMSGLDALLPACLAGVRCRVHGEHGWDVDNLRGQRIKPRLLRRLHAPMVTRYVAVSRDLERYLVHGIGVSPERITHICNGVDTERFAPARDRDLSWLPEDFRRPGVLRVGTVGRLQPVKDQATLLRAFAAWLARDSGARAQARLVLVGDGPLAAPLRELAGALGLADRCFFAGARHDVPRTLGALDLFVLPSLNEGISNTVLEAMAAGLPVLVTAVGGNVELVPDGEVGRHFVPGDVFTLADLLQAYGADIGLRRAHAQAARARALAKYSLPVMVGAYRQLYDDLMRK